MALLARQAVMSNDVRRQPAGRLNDQVAKDL